MSIRLCLLFFCLIMHSKTDQEMHWVRQAMSRFGNGPALLGKHNQLAATHSIQQEVLTHPIHPIQQEVLNDATTKLVNYWKTRFEFIHPYSAFFVDYDSFGKTIRNIFNSRKFTKMYGHFVVDPTKGDRGLPNLVTLSVPGMLRTRLENASILSGATRLKVDEFIGRIQGLGSNQFNMVGNEFGHRNN